MEHNVIITFGDFTEKERLLYFSKESSNSSAIEFPEDFLLVDNQLYEQPNTGVFQPSAQPVEDENAENTKESDSSCGEGSPENELVTDSKDGNIDVVATTKCGAVLECQTNELNENYEVNDELLEREVSDSPESNPGTDSQEATMPSQNEQNFIQDDVSPDSLWPVEECPPVCDQKAPDASGSSEASSSTNVVTVGTKTMMTNTTSNVESGRIEPMKSSWADLFKTKPSSKPQGPLQPILKQPDSGTPGHNSLKKDHFQHYFADVLKRVEMKNEIPRLQPRGLKNNSNWCYINATLQVLIFCPSFYHLLMQFRLKTERGSSSTPILDALVLFASQFSKMPPRQQVGKPQEWGKQEIVMGMPFEPTYVYDLLFQVKTTLSQQGKQEDAEEFLSCILNGLHEEMVQLASLEDNQDVSSNHSDTPPKSEVKDEGSGEWEQVGPRNKSTVTRKSTMAKSPVAEIFCGYLRSSLVQPGVRESASIQPFFSIQLDLRGEVTTVQQAFNNFFTVEEVEGFQCDKSKMEVEVSKKWTLNSLPPVLVLHLKRFVVNKNVCEKLTKKISYDAELNIPQDTLSKGLRIRNKNALTYKLFAITYHHGKNLNGGHYTSDIFHPTVGWLRADDVIVKLIPRKYVFNPLSNRDPYLLYYRRGDII